MPFTTRLIVPLSQTDARAMRSAMDAAAAAGADLVEIRLDYLDDRGEQALQTLLAAPPCPVLATCRRRAEGGRFDGSAAEQITLLARAAELGAQWIDIELAHLAEAQDYLRQLRTRQAQGQPAPGVILSAHDFTARPDAAPLLARMEAAAADVNKLAFAAAGPEDAWAAFDVLHEARQAGRRPAIALAMGEHGLPSRILARKFGGFGTFAALSAGEQSAPGQPTVAELRGLYRWDRLTSDTRVFGVIGCPVGHSLSPAIHNAAFEADGMDAVYVPLRVEPGAAAFDRFLDAVLARPWSDVTGLSVTIPHKENALARVGPENVDELSRAIGAINTIAFTGDARRPLRGCNTDYAAAIDALAGAMACGRQDLAGRSVAVLGAGGAARAIVAALAHYGARTCVYNRTVERARQLAEEFDRPAGQVEYRGLDEPPAPAEIIINCTPLGMHPKVDACPLPESFRFSPGMVVFDTIYNPVETLLLRRAVAAGCRCVSGVDMFVNQAVAQYEFWTHRPAPREVMRRVVLEQLG